MPTLKLKGASLNYEVDDFTHPWLRDKTETVIMHHGCGRHLGYWYRWVPLLARTYRVVRIDARGFGKSSDPGPDYKYSIESFADDVIALMDHLEISKAHFVGEHMGSYTGLQIALQRPERIQKLVISSAPYFSQPVGPMLDRLNSSGIKGYVQGDTQFRFGNHTAYGRWYAEESAKTRPNVLKSVMQAAGSVDYRDRLSQLKSPALVLMGEAWANRRDPDGKVRAFLGKTLPASSEVMVIKGAPWFVVFTNPELCARLSMRFFKKKV